VNKRYGLTSLVLVCALLVLGMASGAWAQDNIVLTLVVDRFQAEQISDEMLATFEAAHPGVKVVLKESDGGRFFPPAAYDLTSHLDSVETYVTNGDVMLVSSQSLSVEATRAGYFLDLTPLVSADATLNSADYYSNVWQSVQWDGGIWALPAAADVFLMLYDPAAFDAAGLSYPNAAWTLDDYAYAIRQLAATNPDQAPFSGSFQIGEELLLRAALGAGLYDPASLPSNPDFSNPNLQSILETWSGLYTDGALGSYSQINFDEVPLRLDSSTGFGLRFGDNSTQAGALLPGGVAGLNVDSFAVSAGTAYPMQAYELAKFLTHQIEAVDSLFGAFPARQSLQGLQNPNGGGGPGRGGRAANANLSPEHQAIIQAALQNALPVSEQRFMGYLSLALSTLQNGETDAFSALQEAEQTALSNLQSAAERGAETAVFVATPVPTPVLSSDEVALNFGYVSFITPLPNAEEWARVQADFIALDPQVGHINFETPRTNNTAELVESYDCFMLPYNAVDGMDLSTVLNLDPFLDTDPTFERSDVLGGVLAQVQQDNKTWALPYMLQPQIMRYHYETFMNNGIIPPDGSWTIDQFTDALRLLKQNAADEQAPFQSNSFGNTYLLMLMAAYGGVPLDFRSDPPTVNFTDPTTVAAIQQVLDLAKDGYILYEELSNLGGGRVFSFSDQENPVPIVDQALNGFGGGGFAVFIQGGNGEQPADPYRNVSYPSGSQYTPLAYTIGTAYISTNTPNPDACYRWLTTISQNPQLFNAMPARASLIEQLASSETPETLAFYRQFAAQLASPNTLPLQSRQGFSAPEAFLRDYWLGKAFDRYVLEDADLLTELEDAQTLTLAYQECVASIPPYDPSAYTDQRAYFEQFAECGARLDPDLAAMLGG